MLSCLRSPGESAVELTRNSLEFNFAMCDFNKLTITLPFRLLHTVAAILKSHSNYFTKPSFQSFSAFSIRLGTSYLLLAPSPVTGMKFDELKLCQSAKRISCLLYWRLPTTRAGYVSNAYDRQWNRQIHSHITQIDCTKFLHIRISFLKESREATLSSWIPPI